MSENLQQQVGVLGARITEVRGSVQVLQELRAEDRLAAKGLAANVDIIRESVLDIQAKVSNLPCDRNTRRISGLSQKVGEAETTDRIDIASAEAEAKALQRVRDEQDRRLRRIATIVGIAGTAAGLGLFKLLALAGCG